MQRYHELPKHPVTDEVNVLQLKATCDIRVFLAVAMTMAAISCSSPPASSCGFVFKEDSFIS